MTAASNSDATYIALDGDNEPTLWREGHNDQPIALFRRCDVGEAGWAWVTAAYQAASAQISGVGAPNSPNEGPSGPGGENGAQANSQDSGAIGRLNEAETVDALLACLPMHEDGTGHIADCGYDWEVTAPCGCASLPGRLADLVREHADRALAEALADIRTRRQVFNRLGAHEQYLMALDDAFGLVNNRLAIVRAARQERGR